MIETTAYIQPSTRVNDVSSTGKSIPQNTLEEIDNHLNLLPTKDAKIVYLEDAYSRYDTPSHSANDESSNVLEGIKSRIADLDPQYFKTDISNSCSSFSILGVELQPRQASGFENNCLIHAIYQKNTDVPPRNKLFTPQAMSKQLDTMTNNSAATPHERFLLQRAIVVAIYGGRFETAATLDDLSRELSEYLTNSQCFLDSQIAAGVVARSLRKTVVIISPAETCAYTCKVINHEGVPVGLASDELSWLLKDPNTCLVWNKNGTHFELLEPVPTRIDMRRRL